MHVQHCICSGIMLTHASMYCGALSSAAVSFMADGGDKTACTATASCLACSLARRLLNVLATLPARSAQAIESHVYGQAEWCHLRAAGHAAHSWQWQMLASDNCSTQVSAAFPFCLDCFLVLQRQQQSSRSSQPGSSCDTVLPAETPLSQAERPCQPSHLCHSSCCSSSYCSSNCCCACFTQ